MSPAADVSEVRRRRGAAVVLEGRSLIMSRTSKALTVAVVVALGAGAWTVYLALESVHNAYAVWWVADMVVEHMKANDGAWPNDWDDLRDDYETCTARSGRPWSFEDLSTRVTVDWHAQPSRLAEQARRDSVSPFRVIWLANGSESHWEGMEPNQIIVRYLNSADQIKVQPRK
jgi:hypothetical protein